MSVVVNYNFQANVAETLTLGHDQAADPVVNHSITGGRGSLPVSGGTPATEVWSDNITLSTGHTIDLRALPDRLGIDGVADDKDFDGLKVQLVKIVAPAGNAADLVFKKGASNGYNLFGGTSWIAVPPGGTFQAYMNDGLADVSATVKTIDVTGTDDDTFTIILVAG